MANKANEKAEIKARVTELMNSAVRVTTNGVEGVVIGTVSGRLSDRRVIVSTAPGCSSVYYVENLQGI